MRFGILANLAVILMVSGALLFIVFTASLQHALVDDATERAGLLADETESRLERATSVADVWRWARSNCGTRPDVRVRLYDAAGREIGGGCETEVSEPTGSQPSSRGTMSPRERASGRRIHVTEAAPYRSVLRGAVVVTNVWGDFPFGVRSFRAFVKVRPALFSNAWSFFGAYLLLTQTVLFFLGYLLFQRTVLQPLRSLADLAGKAAALAGASPLEDKGGHRDDTRVIASGLRRMITEILEAAQAKEVLIGDLKKSNEELAAAQEGLIRSEKMAVTGRLAAGLAHEIGNPLQILMGYAELLSAGDDPALTQDILPRMESELRRINDTIRRLLEFARPGLEEAQACDVNRLAHECVRLLESRPGFRHIRLTETYAADLPEIVTEAEKVRQILVNLLFNAADAVPCEGGEITVQTRTGIQSVELQIADSGCGIPEAHIERVFDPFFTTKEPGKGTGLGLSVSLALAESIGATIGIASTEHKGAVATLSLPLRREP